MEPDGAEKILRMTEPRASGAEKKSLGHIKHFYSQMFPSALFSNYGEYADSSASSPNHLLGSHANAVGGDRFGVADRPGSPGENHLGNQRRVGPEPVRSPLQGARRRSGTAVLASTTVGQHLDLQLYVGGRVGAGHRPHDEA